MNSMMKESDDAFNELRKGLFAAFLNKNAGLEILQLFSGIRLDMNKSVDSRNITYFACIYSSLEKVKLLLENGADPNLCGSEVTVIYILMYNEKFGVNMLNLLLDHGADLHFDCTQGQDLLPFHFPIEQNRLDLLRVVLERGKKDTQTSRYLFTQTSWQSKIALLKLP